MLNLVTELPEDLPDVGTQKLEWEGWSFPVYNLGEFLGRKGDKVTLVQGVVEGELIIQIGNIEPKELELEDPIFGLGGSIRELIDNYLTGHTIQVCTIVGLLQCISNEILIENSTYDIIDPDYTDPEDYDAL